MEDIVPDIYFNAGDWKLNDLALRIADLMFGRDKHLSEFDMLEIARRAASSVMKQQPSFPAFPPQPADLAEQAALATARALFRPSECFSLDDQRWQIGSGNNWILTVENADHKDMRLSYRYDSLEPHILARHEALRATLINFCGLGDTNCCAEKLKVTIRLAPSFQLVYPQDTQWHEDHGGCKHATYTVSPLLASHYLHRQIVPDGALRDHPDRRSVSLRMCSGFPNEWRQNGILNVSLEHVAE